MSEIQIAHPAIFSRRITNLIAAVLLAIFATLLISSVRQESQTFDESTHLYAGFEYWKHGDFGRNPEHPPLVKLLAATPLLPLGLSEPSPLPIPFFKAQDLVNGVQFLYATNANAVLLRGRLVVALFSLMLGLLIFLAARELFGPLAGLFALFLFTFQPLLLANGALVTTDMALACLLFASVYTFYRFCNQPSVARLALVAVLTGLTVITKHSGLLVLPILAVLALVDYWFPKDRTSVVTTSRKGDARRLAYALIVIVIVSYFAVWAVYGFRYAARPGQLQLLPSLAAYTAMLNHPLQAHLVNFSVRHHLLPEAYLYGWVDILLIPGKRPTFLFGHLYSSGQWFFFPAVFVIKTTLALLLFLVLLPVARIVGHRRELVFFATPAAFYVLVAIVSLMNMGARYIIPAYPFLLLLAGAAASSLWGRSVVFKVLECAALLLAVVSTLHAWPNFLVYSNEFFGGPSHTSRYVTDPDADWGQGLKWSKIYLDQHHDSNCWFDYHGNPAIDLKYFGIPCQRLLSGFHHIIGAGTQPIPSTLTGTILVSSTDIDGALWGPGSLNPYQVFRDRTPDDTIGNIIFVYRGTFYVPLLAAETNALAAVGLLRRGRLPEALALAQTAEQQAPDSADVNATLGQILLASGRTAEGQVVIAKALRLAQTQYPDFQKYLVDELQHPSRP
jgi:4-amino-4-deoxy-L-arabinose transferase-like glycosyltransferase